MNTATIVKSVVAVAAVLSLGYIIKRAIKSRKAANAASAAADKTPFPSTKTVDHALSMAAEAVVHGTVGLARHVVSPTPVVPSEVTPELLAFNSLWDMAQQKEPSFRELAYDSAWENGTGYLDRAVKASLPLAEGEIGFSMDPFNRRILMFPTSFGNVVYFSRYENRNDLVTHNSPSGMSDQATKVVLLGQHARVERDVSARRRAQ